jgi:hypothetical protein
MSALERLDAIDARVTASTGEPWVNNVRLIRAQRLLGPRTVAATDLPADADFIAGARQDVPALATALRAILALHAPEQHVGHECCSEDGAGYPCATVRIIETELAR